MKKEINVTFTVGTNAHGSERQEQKTFEFDEGMTDEQIEDEIQELFNEWVWDHINADWEYK